jgi:enoyl reductase-like protein
MAEFFQCIEEMTRADWMQKPIEELMLSAREEAEIKAAKEKQVNDIADHYGQSYGKTDFKSLLSLMQHRGDLAEPKKGYEND